MDELRLGKFTQKLNLPVVIVAPLCSRNTWFDLFKHLEGLVKELAARVYTAPSLVL